METKLPRRIKININDIEFPHTLSRGCGDLELMSDKIEWVRDNSSPYQVEIFTDRMVSNVLHSNAKIKIAWLLEPIEFNPGIYEMVRKYEGCFDFIFTHEFSMIDNKKYIFIPHGGCWINNHECEIYDKSKNVSIVSSGKNITSGHKLRNLIVETIKDDKDIGLYGRKYNPIGNKLISFKDYRFQIVVENSRSPLYFTEKIIDCFSTGTVPIYWGASDIGDFFDERGIITLNDINDLDINKYNEEVYNKMKPYIEENYKRSSEYRFSENVIHSFLEGISI
tara:strand:+ start:1557 stop:2396 length:840 start_codon:yes stop_codon:yes gene_type:complete